MTPGIIFLERLIRRAKYDPSYRVDPSVDARSVFSILWTRAVTMLHGELRKRMFRQATGLVFVGKGVTLRHSHLLSVGRSCVLEDYVTIDALSREGIAIGDRVTIERYATLRASGTLRALGRGIKIGSDTAIGAYSYIGAAGGVEIGDSVLLGQRVTVLAENHLFDDVALPIRSQGVSRRGIKIGNDCWIGSNALILDGVEVGRGAVVGAGSVVTEDVPPLAVVVGVPARFLRWRGCVADRSVETSAMTEDRANRVAAEMSCSEEAL